jgi:hypothetical protein
MKDFHIPLNRQERWRQKVKRRKKEEKRNQLKEVEK